MFPRKHTDSRSHEEWLGPLSNYLLLTACAGHCLRVRKDSEGDRRGAAFTEPQCNGVGSGESLSISSLFLRSGAWSFQHDLSMSLCCNSPQARASEKASTFAHQPDTGLLQAHRCWHFPQCGWRCPHTGGRSEPHTCPPSRLRHSGSAGRRSEARPHLLTQSSQRSFLGVYALHHSCGYGPLATGPATSVSGWR